MLYRFASRRNSEVHFSIHFFQIHFSFYQFCVNCIDDDDMMMIWWYDDDMMMIWWWYDDMMMIWWWWYDVIWWYGMIWWYDDMIWYDEMIWWSFDMIWFDDDIAKAWFGSQTCWYFIGFIGVGEKKVPMQPARLRKQKRSERFRRALSIYIYIHTKLCNFILQYFHCLPLKTNTYEFHSIRKMISESRRICLFFNIFLFWILYIIFIFIFIYILYQ